MSRREEILVKHREAIRSAASRHRARSIALAGSVARGDDRSVSSWIRRAVTRSLEADRT